MNLAEALNSEIQFWQDMINQQTEQTAPEIRERLEMAKLLAESKLAVLFGDCHESIN